MTPLEAAERHNLARDREIAEERARKRWLEWLPGSGLRAFIVFDKKLLIQARL